MLIPEAFLLLTIPNATVTVAGYSETGMLFLECVTVQLPDASRLIDRDVYLVIRLGSIEAPIDPTQVIHKTESQGHRTYSFHPVESDSDSAVLVISIVCGQELNPNLLEDLGTFETIFAQYAADFYGPPSGADAKAPIKPPTSGLEASHGDLRGHLVVVNQDNGEIVAQFDRDTYKLQEDPQLHEQGHENDAVIIEVPDNRPGNEQDATALQMFARAIPPDEQDWITKSATIVSHAISTTTNLLLTTISTASNYYISHSKPSPHHSASPSPNGTPAPGPPPRALVFLTSERTRKGLAGVHAVSSQAVKVSSKTVSVIDGMIRRAMGSKPKRQRLFAQPVPAASNGLSSMLMAIPTASVSVSGSRASVSPKLPPRTPSPSYAHLSPPPYTNYPSSPNDGKPALPPRRSPSPANAPPLPPRTSPGFPDTGVPPVVAPQPRVPLSKKERILLSADLILSTLDHETRRALDVGTASIGAVMNHKYGVEAAESSLLMAGTARNVGLVYVDMRGIGRRALLKRAGGQFVKGRLSNNK